MTLQDCVLNIGIEYLQHILSEPKKEPDPIQL